MSFFSGCRSSLMVAAGAVLLGLSCQSFAADAKASGSAGSDANYKMSSDETALLKKLKEKFPKADIYDQVEKVAPDIYEIWVEDRQAYTNSQINGLFVGGELLDPENMKNISKTRFENRLGRAFEDLPLQDAIVSVYGKGTAKIAMFTDPDCPFCKEQEKILEENKANLDLTVYRFFLPIKTRHPDATKHAAQIICSANPAKALIDFQLNSTALTADECAKGIKATREQSHYGNELLFNSTPTFIFPNNKFAVGYMDLPQLHKLLKLSGQEP